MTISNNDNTETYVNRIINYILEKKGEDTVVLDLRSITSVTDFFIITTGRSNVHLKALADEICENLKKEENITPWHVEGYEAKKWILLDYVDVVVHIFDFETRSFYSLEKLWDDADKRYIET